MLFFHLLMLGPVYSSSNILPSHSGHAEVCSVNHRNAVCKSRHQDQPAINAMDNFVLLRWRIFFVPVDIVAGWLVDIFDIFHARRLFVFRLRHIQYGGLLCKLWENKEVVYQHRQPLMSFLYPKYHLGSIWLQ